MHIHHLQKQTHHKHLRVPLSYKKHVVVDTMASMAGVVSPLMTIPQIYTIFANRTAAGVSLPSWGTYTLFAGVWLLYGVIHKEKVILYSNILILLADAAVVVGILRF